MVEGSNKGPRGFALPGTGAAKFDQVLIDWSDYFPGMVILPDVRAQIELTIRGYRMNAAVCLSDEMQIMTDAQFERKVLATLNNPDADIFGADWGIFRLVQMLTPEISGGLTRERAALAINQYRTVPDQIRWARQEIRSDAVQDILPQSRECDAFNYAVQEIHRILAVNGFSPTLSHTRVTERRDTNPSEFERFVCDQLRDNGYSPASLKAIYNAMKNNHKVLSVSPRS